MLKTMKNRIISCLAITLLLGFVASCDNNDDWKPGEFDAANPGVFFDLTETTIRLIAQPYADPLVTSEQVVVTLGRDENKSGASLVLPISILNKHDALAIPQSVTFAAGSSTADLVIDVNHGAEGGVFPFLLEFDVAKFNPYLSNAYNQFNGEVLVLVPIVPENIATYEQGATVRSHEAFLNGGNARYNPTLMSPRIAKLLEDYAEIIYEHELNIDTRPIFNGFTLEIPSGNFSMGLIFSYTQITTNSAGTHLFTWSHTPAAAGLPGLVMMREPDNPNSDVVFSIPTFTSRTGGIAFSASGFATAPGGSGPFMVAFRAFLQDPAGLTIIQCWQNPSKFWFRSKADPTDWIVFERFFPVDEEEVED